MEIVRLIGGLLNSFPYEVWGNFVRRVEKNKSENNINQLKFFTLMKQQIKKVLDELNPVRDLDRLVIAETWNKFRSLRIIHSAKSMVRGGAIGLGIGYLIGQLTDVNVNEAIKYTGLTLEAVDFLQYNIRHTLYMYANKERVASLP